MIYLCVSAIDGSWGQWGPYSECSETCEPGGVKTRVRSCSAPAPQHGGKYCPGYGTDTIPCNTETSCLLVDIGEFMQYNWFINAFEMYWMHCLCWSFIGHMWIKSASWALGQHFLSFCLATFYKVSRSLCKIHPNLPSETGLKDWALTPVYIGLNWISRRAGPVGPQPSWRASCTC